MLVPGENGAARGGVQDGPRGPAPPGAFTGRAPGQAFVNPRAAGFLPTGGRMLAAGGLRG